MGSGCFLVLLAAHGRLTLPGVPPSRSTSLPPAQRLSVLFCGLREASSFRIFSVICGAGFVIVTVV
jgi:hypothetical protein